MASDLVERLMAKRVRVHDLSGVGYETDPDCSEAVARMTVDAARIAALEAELAEARAERDELDALYHEGGTWEQQLSAAEARATAAEARAEKMAEALAKLLACPAIADENHSDPEWGDAETAEAVAFARAALGRPE